MAASRHIHKSKSRRHRHRRSSSDRENSSPRVSFLHQKGKKPFLTLHEQFRAVNIKYFKQIFFGTFKPEHLTKLAHTPTNRSVDNDEDEVVPEATNLTQLHRCFMVYGLAICFYAHPTVAPRLYETLAKFQIRLLDMSVYYEFESIREYLYSFMATRISTSQDDPLAWDTEDRKCAEILISKPESDRQFDNDQTDSEVYGQQTNFEAHDQQTDFEVYDQRATSEAQSQQSNSVS